jgi:ectoine hydroxylase-related dioxygenase (phytanoyl-CoA dioxygenase family)
MVGVGLQEDGYEIVEGAVSESRVEELRGAMEAVADEAHIRRRGEVYGIRNLLSISAEAREAARELKRLVEPAMGAGCFAVRATFLDKVPGANWKIAWHQDGMISVRERIEVEGFGPWSVKGGAAHVQPPVGILSRMLAARLHLDDCGRENGALRVLPGTYRHGWIDHEVDRWRSEVAEKVCEVRAGGVLLMRPLILHASSSAASPRHRRVIHIEYAMEDLPGGLEWRDRVG